MESLLTPVSGFVEWGEFLHAIALAAHPDPVFFPGLEGVLGRRRVVLGFPFDADPLIAEDAQSMRAFMEEHAEALPKLKAEMQDAEITAFLTAFRSLEDRPDWEPVFFSVSTLRDLRLDARLTHSRALKQLIADRHLRHFDIHRAPAVPNMDFRTYFPLEDARKYLREEKLEGAEIFIRSTNTCSDEPTKGKVEHVDEVATPDTPAANAPTALRSDSAQEVPRSRKKRSKSELGMIYYYAEEHDVAAAAKKYGLGEKQIRNLCRRFDDLRALETQQEQEQRSHTKLHTAMYMMGGRETGPLQQRLGESKEPDSVD